jgi:hypothetical protein
MPSIGAAGWPGYAAYRPNKMEAYAADFIVLSSCFLLVGVEKRKYVFDA